MPVRGKTMKQLIAVSFLAVLALAVIVSLACEGPAPTPAAPAPELTMPPATQVVPPMPSPTPAVASTPTQAPATPSAPAPTRAPTPGPAPTAQPEPAPAGPQIEWLEKCTEGFECGGGTSSGGLPRPCGRQHQHRGQRASGHVSGETDRLSIGESRRPGRQRCSDGHRLS